MFGVRKQLEKMKDYVYRLDKKTDELMVYVPLLYKHLIKSRPPSTYPCKEIQRRICAECNKRSCVYHPETTANQTADEIMDNFIKTAYCHK